MVIVLVSLAYALCLIYLAGFATLRGIQVCARHHDGAYGVRPIDALFAGIAILTTLASAVSLLRPVDLATHVGLLTLALLGGIAFRKELTVSIRSGVERAKALPLPLHVLAILALLAASLRAAGGITWYDTGLYHLQAVKWIRLYGVVPGLGNLHDRLAFNSSWFVFGALWDVGPLAGLATHVSGMIAWTLGLAMCVHAAVHTTHGGRARAEMVMLGAAPALYHYRDTLCSLSPDLPAALFVIYVLSRALSILDGGGAGARSRAVWLTAMSAFALTLKLSVAPVLLVPLAMAWHRRNARPALAALVAAAALLGPFVARNVVLSGYPFFPLPVIDIVQVDWKVPKRHAMTTQLITKAWALEPGRPYTEVLAEPKEKVFSRWLRNNLVAPRTAYLLAAFLVGSVWMLCTWRRRYIQEPAVLRLWLCAAAGVLFWAVAAPDVRFGFAWLCCGLLLPGCSAMARAGSRWAAAGLTFVCLSVAWRLPPPVLARVQPVPIAAMHRRQVNGVGLWVPDGNDRAYDAPLPSAPFAPPGLLARGPRLTNGFRWQETPRTASGEH